MKLRERFVRARRVPVPALRREHEGVRVASLLGD